MKSAGDSASETGRSRPPRSRTALIAGSIFGVALAAMVALAWAGSMRPAENPDEVWSRAEEAVAATRWDEADAGLKRLSALRPPTGKDRMLRAQIAMGRNRTDEAIAGLASIDDKEPLAAQARMLAGQLELRRRRLRPAEAFLRRALELDPNLISARKELIYIFGMQIRRADLAEQFLALSKQMPLTFEMIRLWCLTRGSIWEPTAHTKDLKLFLDADPDDARTRLAMAEMFQAQGLADEAEAALRPLPADASDVVAIRARVAFDRGDVDSARALLARGPADHPGLARLRGRLDLLRRDPKAAIRDFEVAERVDPGQRDTLYGLGHAYRLLGDEARAAPYLKSAQALDRLSSLLSATVTPASRADPDVPRKLAEACLAAGRIPEARAWLKLALARDPLDESIQRELYRINQGETTADSR